jgi:FG-GAP-like repeat/Insecticide toxin TcdB middle/N-terminal region
MVKRTFAAVTLTELFVIYLMGEDLIHPMSLRDRRGQMALVGKRVNIFIQHPDLNGDGRTDICGRDANGIICYLNSGKEFDLANPIRGPAWADVPEPFPIPRDENVPEHWLTPWQRDEHFLTIQFPDINGDGLPDICGRSRRGIECYLGTGKGFLSTAILGPFWANSDEPLSRAGVTSPSPHLVDTDGTTWESEPGGARYYAGIRFADINGDGKADVCARRRDGVVCHLSAGTGFTEKVVGPDLKDANYWEDRRGLTLTARDVDADGKADLCVLTDAGVQCWLNRAPGRLRLTKIFNGIGGTTSLIYANNTKGSDWRIPIAIQVIDTITVDDGVGTLSQTEYWYNGGG